MFYEHGQICYQISLHKEILKRKIQDFFSNTKFAKIKNDVDLDFLIKAHTSLLNRKLLGVDERLQLNKIRNIEIACKAISGLVIKPGETFSFWKLIGRPSRSRGFKEGLVIKKDSLSSGYGGGLCQMANMIHWLVLHTPLDVIELHHHSDALFPDYQRRVPFGTGTSVSYNAVDYRFKNNTDTNIQLLVWIDDGYLCGEIRSDKQFDCKYKIIEEDSQYKEENGIFYRCSKVFKLTIDKKDSTVIKKELVLDNHSKVMYDYNLIPKEEIRND